MNLEQWPEQLICAWRAQPAEARSVVVRELQEAGVAGRRSSLRGLRYSTIYSQSWIESQLRRSEGLLVAAALLRALEAA
jgi:hypothetical protein